MPSSKAILIWGRLPQVHKEFRPRLFSLSHLIVTLNVRANDKLANRVQKAGEHLHASGKLDQRQLSMLKKFQHSDHLVPDDKLT